jgi:hypothetical protein
MFAGGVDKIFDRLAIAKKERRVQYDYWGCIINNWKNEVTISQDGKNACGRLKKISIPTY